MKKVVYAEKEYIECMSSVGKDRTNGFCVVVNPDGNRLGNAYFKYCNSCSYARSSKVIRIMFDKCEYVFHKNKDGKETWKLNSKDKKRLCEFLPKDCGRFPGFTYYQFACFLWNVEMDIIDDCNWPSSVYSSALDAYARGWYDDKEYSQHPSYIPSTVKMPNYTQLPTVR